LGASAGTTFGVGLASLYALAQCSPNLFASPLGPFTASGRSVFLPRFVFFGPHVSNESSRLSLLAGFDRRDARASLALLDIPRRLAAAAATAHGLHLTFFPVVDASGAFAGTAYRGLAAYHWSRSPSPELCLLERDARQNAYRGFVRLETGSEVDDVVCVRLCAPSHEVLSPDIELFASDDAAPFPVRFEAGPQHRCSLAGPLSIADDLPVTLFELTVRVPGAWPETTYREAAASILINFVRRYRALQAYGQNL
jgi:hypothetical protein